MNRNYRHDPVIAFFLALLLYLVIFALFGIFPGSEKTILSGDLYAQYEGFIRMFLRVLQGKEDLWYSFSLYYGSGTALTYAYYAFSPFNLLYLIPFVFFPTMTLIITALKHALAAAFFCLFLQKVMKRKGAETIFFALCYALCTFGVGMYLHIMWFDAVFTLPLVVISIHELLERNRMLPLILSYAYLFFTNFYMGFILGVFTGLAFLWMLLYRTKTFDRASVKSCLRSLIRYAFCGILAAGLCAVVLVPAALFLFGHSAADNFEFTPLKASLSELLTSFMMGEMSSMDNDIPFNYCSLPVLLLIPVYFSVHGISKKEKILTVGLFLVYGFASFYLPLYTAMHAFDYPNWYAFRFSYAIVFLMITCACRAYPHLREYSTRSGLIFISVLLFLYSVLIPLFPLFHRSTDVGNTQPHFMINLAFLLLWFLLFYIIKKHTSVSKKAGIAAVILLCVELVSNGQMILRNLDLTYIKKTQYRNWSGAIEDSLDSINRQDPGFFRLHVNNDVISNSGAVFGFHSLSAFNSSDDYELRHAMSGLGIATTNRGIYDIGYYDIVDMLIGAKYTVEIPRDLFSPDKVYDSLSPGDVSVSTFEYALPLGYMVSDSIRDYRAGLDAMKNQEELIKAMTGNDYHFYTALPEDAVSVTCFGTNEERVSDLISFYRVNDLFDFAYIIYSADITAEEDFYAYFPVDSPIMIMNSPYLIGSCSGQNTNIYLSGAPLMRGLRNNGDFEETPDGRIGSVMISFKPETSADYAARAAIFKIYRRDSLPDVYKDLSSSVLQIDRMSSSDIHGTVTVSADRPVLFTTIPFDSDWHAEADGISVPTEACVENAFLSVPLTPGEHSIRLYYIPSGYKEGRLISLLSLAVLMFLILRSLLLLRQRQNSNKEAASV